MAVRRHVAAARAPRRRRSIDRRRHVAPGTRAQWFDDEARRARRSAVPAQLLEFLVSRDEEHVRMLLHVRGGVVDLGERAHHYSLVTLARARSADMQAGYDAATQGWIELDRLARMLGIDTSHVNVQIHRARSQFAALPGLGASQLVERRRGSVRFGDFPFRVMRGAHLECESVPPAQPRIGVHRPAPAPVVHCS